MAVIDLRGGRPLTEIGRGFGTAIEVITNPHKKEREDFSRNLQQNPNLLRQLRQIAADSPDPLQALKDIFPNIDDRRLQAIIDIRQTAAQQAEDFTRTGLTPVKEGGIATPETISDIQATGAARTVGATPEQLAAGPRRAAAVGGLPQEVFERGAEVREGGGLTRGAALQDELNADLIRLTMTAIGEMDVDDKTKGALRAKAPSFLLDADRQDDFRRREDLLQQQLKAAAERDRLNRLSREGEGRLNRKDRNRLAELSGQSATDAANARLSIAQDAVAARWLDKTNAGSPEAWKRFLYDSASRDLAQSLLSGSEQVDSKADLELLAVAQAFSDADDLEKVTERAAVQRQVNILLGEIDKVDRDGNIVLDESTREHLVLQLNSSLTELAVLSRNPQGVALLDTRPRRPLKIIDPNDPQSFPGEEIDRLIGLETGGPVLDQETDIGTQVFNFETVDVSQLSQESIQNLRLLQNGASFEALRNVAPKSADEILAALRR